MLRTWGVGSGGLRVVKVWVLGFRVSIFSVYLKGTYILSRSLSGLLALYDVCFRIPSQKLRLVARSIRTHKGASAGIVRLSGLLLKNLNKVTIMGIYSN